MVRSTGLCAVDGPNRVLREPERLRVHRSSTLFVSFLLTRAGVPSFASPRALLGDRLPDELGDVDHEIGWAVPPCSYLTDRYTDHVVQASVALVLAQVEDGAHDLPAASGIRPAVAVPLEHDRRAVISLDHRPEVRPKRSVSAPKRVVRTPEAPADTTVASPIGDVKMLLPVAAQADRPALRICEADPVQGFEPHDGALFQMSKDARKEHSPRFAQCPERLPLPKIAAQEQF